MAYYLVQAKLKGDSLTELRSRLDGGEIRQMQPFGRALQYSLDSARIEKPDWAVWEEEDYCNPPLAQERAAVLDTYFTDLSVELVEQGKGWEQVASLPKLWDD